MDKVLLIYDQDINYDFGKAHPMNPERIKLTYRLIESLNLLEKPEVITARAPAAEEAELRLVHTQSYIEAVKEASKGKVNWYFGLGTGDNPVFPEMHQASAKIAGASLLAARMLIEGKVSHAFNPWGGLHHALSNKASGFCIYNDAAIAIAWILKEGKKVAYVDIDAHHGDGVQWIFYSNPNVLTISLHESGYYLFPGSGFTSEKGADEGAGFSVNIPLDPEATESDYLLAIREIVKPLIERFKPDILVTQNGCDNLKRDPLTHLQVSLKGYFEIVKELHQLAHRLTEGKILALGGGGYDTSYSVPIAWASLFADLCHTRPPEFLPDTYLKLLKESFNLASPQPFWGKIATSKPALPSTEKIIAQLKKEFSKWRPEEN